MHRYICSLGPVNIFSYGVMLALAFAFGAWFAGKRAAGKGIPKETVYDLVLYILIGSLAGARALFVALNAGYYLEHSLDLFKIWEGGLVLYGGIAGGFAAGVYYLRKRRLPVWRVADAIAPSLAIGVAIGRVGCFLNGCCYGKLSSRLGVCFPAANMPPAYEEQLRHGLIPPGAPCSLPVMPTQLYESAVCLAIAVFLLFIERRRRGPEGSLFWFFIMLYSLQRFFMEGLRYYEGSFLAGPLTVGQLLSVVIFAAALAVSVRLSKRHGRVA